MFRKNYENSTNALKRLIKNGMLGMQKHKMEEKELSSVLLYKKGGIKIRQIQSASLCYFLCEYKAIVCRCG